MMQPNQVNPRMSGDKRVQMPNNKLIPLTIVGGNGFGRYPKISSEQTFNMIVSDQCLVPFYGYTTSSKISPNGQGREIYNSVKFNHLIAVIDDGVYSIAAGGSFSRVGTLNTSSGPAYIADNDAGQIAISDQLNIYIFNYIANTFQIVTTDFIPGTIAYQDTYFISPALGTNQWRLSANNDGTSWPPDAQHVGEFQTKTANVVAVTPLDRQLYVFGQTGCEPWYDVGNILFPYQRTNFYSVDYGVLNAETIATGFDMMVWLGSNEKSGIALLYSQGAAPQQISTDGLNFVFSRLKNPQDSFGFLFKLDGHIYYQFTFRTDNITYVYDFNTGLFFTLTDNKMNRHIAKRIAFFNNQYFFLSFIDGNIYSMSSDITTFNGQEIPRIRVCQNIRFPNADRFVVDNANITMESGINNSVSRVDMSVSVDGGYSYKTVGSKRLKGLGQRKNEMNFWNLGGIDNDFVMQFRFWGEGRFVIIGGSVSMHT